MLEERLSRDVLALVDEAIELAPEALRDTGPPTLVHGDVWDGNLIVHREHGRWRVVALLDPAVEYADAEMELAYLQVFDASRDVFFAAYTTRHGLRPGYEHRRRFYWLHTGLLHVALFGDDVFSEFTARTAEAICRDAQHP
jgi:fructosamine-3-kinase